GGTVRFSASRTDTSVVLEVRDTGDGIASDVLPHVFERYYRGGGARTRGKGTGLGLAIARAVAVAHGGALEVESEVGAGSTFRMTLPV
ncbi:sensor histidine kinase, partial [Rubrivirga sp.]|uniref:sensor histidine kinase n=1 Tax=Rubrivirga sp. TaxID=1885344 RepID=UPI003C7186C5